jgi:hypothetical protein
MLVPSDAHLGDIDRIGIPARISGRRARTDSLEGSEETTSVYAKDSPATRRIARLRLIELDEKLNDCFVQLFLSAYSPLLMAGLVTLQGVRATTGVWITIVTIAVIASVW